MTLCGTWLAVRHFKSAPPHLDAPFGLFPVSILKPLKGIENGIQENLETFFQLDYPSYELLFCVADARDPAFAVVERLIKKYPHVSAQLMVSHFDVGPNPKVNNLMPVYQQAQHDWVLISDSNVKVQPDYLKRLVAHLDTDVGMVTATVAGQDFEQTGGALEAIFLNTFYARGMILAAALGKPCVVGKSMLFRRSVAARFGGIESLARYLAEDYMAGEAMVKLGLKVVIAHDPVTQVIGKYGFNDFWARHIRWGRIRKVQVPLAFVAEPLSFSFVSAFFGAVAMHHFFGIRPSHLLTFHFGLWSICDLSLMIVLKTELKFAMPFQWLLRETLALPLWVHIASGNSVNWRGKKLVLKTGGILAGT